MRKSQMMLAVVLIQVFSGILLVAGIIVLALASKTQCGPGCVETSCLGKDYRSYPCDCYTYCQTKGVVMDSNYRFGVSALIIGIIGSISGSILLCIYRRRNYYENQQQQQQAVLVAPPMMYAVQQQQPMGVYAQGQPMPTQYNPYNQGQTPNQNQQYPYEQQIPQQNIPYGVPVTGYPYPDPYAQNQNQEPAKNYQ